MNYTEISRTSATKNTNDYSSLSDSSLTKWKSPILSQMIARDFTPPTSSILMPGSFRVRLPISTIAQLDIIQTTRYEQNHGLDLLGEPASLEISEEAGISVFPDTDQILTVEFLVDMLEKNSYPDEQPDFDLSFDPDDYPLA